MLPTDIKLPEGTKAMIFAAGLGTRLKPFTDQHPKALAIVNGKPLLQRNIEYFKNVGIRDIIINVHHYADQIIDFLALHRHFDCNILVSHETEQALETGGGLKKAAWFFEGSRLPFFVMNVDILTNLDLEEMYAYHLEKKGIATLAVTQRPTSRHFLFNEERLLVGWENITTGEQKLSRPPGIQYTGAFTCVHVIEPAMLGMIRQEGKFSIIDSYLDIARTENVYVYDHTGDAVVDVGKPESIQKAEQLFL